jgi:CheY-like chemotaxis protein
MIIQQRLKKDGHDVVVVEHGGAAVRKFEQDRNFDIILMDLQMPIMGGLVSFTCLYQMRLLLLTRSRHRFQEATRNIRRVELESPVPQADRLRSDLLNTRVPILAVTASLPERERGTIVSAGLDGWALKPLAFDRLRELMLGATDSEKRNENVYRYVFSPALSSSHVLTVFLSFRRPGGWERGGWLSKAPSPQSSRKSSELRTTRSDSISAASETPSSTSDRVF